MNAAVTRSQNLDRSLCPAAFYDDFAFHCAFFPNCFAHIDAP
jgi:hypothetical protein